MDSEPLILPFPLCVLVTNGEAYSSAELFIVHVPELGAVQKAIVTLQEWARQEDPEYPTPLLKYRVLGQIQIHQWWSQEKVWGLNDEQNLSAMSFLDFCKHLADAAYQWDRGEELYATWPSRMGTS